MPKFYSRDVWKQTRYSKQNSTHSIQNLVTFRKDVQSAFQTWQIFLKSNLWIGISFTSYLHETITETSQSFLTSSSRRANRFNWTENKQKTQKRKSFNKTQKTQNSKSFKYTKSSRCSELSLLVWLLILVGDQQIRYRSFTRVTDRTFSRGDSSKMSVVGPSSFRSDLRVEFKNFKSFVDPRSKLTMKLG